MKHFVFSLLTIMALTSLIACGKSSKQITGGNGNSVEMCPPFYQMGSNGCIPLQQGSPQGSVTGPVSYMMEYNKPYGYEIGAMHLSNRSKYETFIEEALQTCNRGNWNGGYYSCDSWISGYQSVMISFDSSTDNTATVQISSFPTYTNFNYQISLWPETFGMSFNPLILEMNVHPINNNGGFELRSYGSTYNEAWGSLIQFRVNKGHLTQSATHLDIEMYYEGTLISRGRAERCGMAACGFH